MRRRKEALGKAPTGSLALYGHAPAAIRTRDLRLRRPIFGRQLSTAEHEPRPLWPTVAHLGEASSEAIAELRPRGPRVVRVESTKTNEARVPRPVPEAHRLVVVEGLEARRDVLFRNTLVRISPSSAARAACFSLFLRVARGATLAR